MCVFGGMFVRVCVYLVGVSDCVCVCVGGGGVWGLDCVLLHTLHLDRVLSPNSFLLPKLGLNQCSL